MLDTLIYLMFFVSLFASKILAINTPIIILTALRLLFLIFIIIKFCQKQKFVIRKNTRFIVVFIVFSFIQLFWIKDFSSWFKIVFILFEALLFFMFLPLQLNTIEKIVKCMKAFVLGACIQMILGYYELFTGNYLFLTDENRLLKYSVTILTKGVHTPTAMCINTNNFATIMFVCGCFSLILFTVLRTKKEKILYGSITISSIILVYCTGSRGNMIAIMLLISLYVLIFIDSKLLKAFIVFSLLASSVLFISLFETYFVASGSDETRLSLYKDAFEFLKQTFFMGIGAGQEEWWFLNRSVYSYGDILVMHNYFLEILCCFGIIPFYFFLRTYLSSIKTLFFNYKSSNSDESRISFGLMCFLVVFLIASLSSSRMLHIEYIWLIYALLFSYINVISGKINACIRAR